MVTLFNIPTPPAVVKEPLVFDTTESVVSVISNTPANADF